MTARADELRALLEEVRGDIEVARYMQRHHPDQPGVDVGALENTCADLERQISLGEKS